jgi:hypothetical protein
MSALGRGILYALDEGDLAELARRLAPFQEPPTPAIDGWLAARQAADYAGCSINALRKAMADGRVHFEQSCAGGKAWFKRSDIDAWRRGEDPPRPSGSAYDEGRRQSGTGAG